MLTWSEVETAQKSTAINEGLLILRASAVQRFLPEQRLRSMIPSAMADDVVGMFRGFHRDEMIAPSCECKKRGKAKVKLANGKELTIQHMICTTFWHPDGTPMLAQQFLELLFGQLPEFFKDEAELRALWSAPDTRKLLLHGLAEKGFGPEQLSEMQKIIDAEKSDIFDVLAYVAYALPPLTREQRAAQAKVAISAYFNSKQQAFLDFVLDHYVGVGVDELDQEKLTPLLRLKYSNSISDAIADLGMPGEISKAFVGFQKYLYVAPL
jgi:type I restriction enzyme, R subunit